MSADYAHRGELAHQALRRRFERGDAMMRRDGRLHRPGAVAHLWPFVRAVVASLDLAGTSVAAAEALAPLLARRLSALERYWDARAGAYASDPPGTRIGGDVYYDDNAWAGLALVQLERLMPGTAPRSRIAALGRFAQSGWSSDETLPSPGGVFWVEQGRGAGTRNHDRNAISTAPNAQLLLHLQALKLPVSDAPGPASMADWVESALIADSGLVRDKLRGDGSVDGATWTYNQGSMIGLLTQLGRVGDAEALAHRALAHYATTGYANEPAAFVAIFMRNLLRLHAASRDESLRTRIETALRERADALWAGSRGGSIRGTLLDQSALASLQALAAWDPARYDRLA